MKRCTYCDNQAVYACECNDESGCTVLACERHRSFAKVPVRLPTKEDVDGVVA